MAEENTANRLRSSSRECSSRYATASALARNTWSIRCGVNASIRPSSSTPAVCTMPVTRHLASRAATASRSVMSQDSMSTVAPAAISSSRSSSAPGAAGPRRDTSSSRRWPASARCRASRWPRSPVPPVIRTVPSGSSGGSVVSTILPVCRLWLMCRNASGACRMSKAVTGRGRRPPLSTSAHTVASRSATRSGDWSRRSKAQ